MINCGVVTNWTEPNPDEFAAAVMLNYPGRMCITAKPPTTELVPEENLVTVECYVSDSVYQQMIDDGLTIVWSESV